MRAADIARRAFSQATLANPTNLANNRATAGPVAVTNACEFCESGATPGEIRNHSQPFANQESRATAGDSQHSQHSRVSRLGDSENRLWMPNNWQRADAVAADLISRLCVAWACPPTEYAELLELHRAGRLSLKYIERLIQDAPPSLRMGGE